MKKCCQHVRNASVRPHGAPLPEAVRPPQSCLSSRNFFQGGGGAKSIAIKIFTASFSIVFGPNFGGGREAKISRGQKSLRGENYLRKKARIIIDFRP